VWLIASSRAGVARERLVLAGVAVNALCGAGLGALTAIANDAQLRGLTFWSLGSLGASDWTVVRATALPLIVACVAARGIARSLDVFALGEHDAMVLGVSSRALFRRSVCVAALAAGAAVAFAGAIGFVGLAVPHIARMLLGSSHRLVMPGAAALGVIAVLLADAVARTAWAPAEVPVGVVSAALGAPFFVWMLLRVPRVAVAS
jgi:iron complex transport system permease protein